MSQKCVERIKKKKKFQEYRYLIVNINLNLKYKIKIINFKYKFIILQDTADYNTVLTTLAGIIDAVL